MAASTTYTCTCGVQKKQTNHWILGRVEDGAVILSRWDEAVARQDDVLTLCGESCAAKLISRTVGDWNAKASAESRPLSEQEEMEVARLVQV